MAIASLEWCQVASAKNSQHGNSGGPQCSQDWQDKTISRKRAWDMTE